MANREREGYVLVDRNILDWKWWRNHNTLIVFMWLLLKAQFHESHWGGVQIGRGQIATSMKNIEFDNQLSRQQVRTAISNLKSTGEITITRHSKFLVITIVNYDKYQNPTIKPTKKQQSNNHQITINQPHTNTYNTSNTIKRSNKGRSAPGSPSGELKRGTDAFRNKSHLLLKQDEGNADDIPARYREQFKDNFADYWAWRNQ